MRGENKVPLTMGCRALGGVVGYVTAWRAVVAGQLPAERIGAQYFVLMSDLRRFAASRKPRPKRIAVGAL